MEIYLERITGQETGIISHGLRKKTFLVARYIYIYIYIFEFKLLLVLYLNFDLGEGDKLRHRPSGVTSLYVIVWKSHAHSALYDWFAGFY